MVKYINFEEQINYFLRLHDLYRSGLHFFCTFVSESFADFECQFAAVVTS
jgi:hypothetical protein